MGVGRGGVRGGPPVGEVLGGRGPVVGRGLSVLEGALVVAVVRRVLDYVLRCPVVRVLARLAAVVVIPVLK